MNTPFAPPQAAFQHRLQRKLAILADAAKYDASCASSGSRERDSMDSAGIGSTNSTGICHSYTPDGRCISVLKILLTNHCQYDCLYCINRSSSNVVRARFTAEEVVQLTLDFYRRNCIEGLFLSSGIIQSPNYTMEQLVRVAQSLREQHAFRGYIHLKTIPDADPGLLDLAGLYADRLSINIELPTVSALDRLAPEKHLETIEAAMRRTREKIDEHHTLQQEHRKLAYPRQATAFLGEPAAEAASLLAGDSALAVPSPARVRVGAGFSVRPSAPPRFAPAGQSTQMIVGAEDTSDKTILATTAHLYAAHRLRRVYYSAYSPIPDASSHLPLVAPPLLREHRLYQADWLLRFYGFSHDELVTQSSGLLRLDMDPKLAWALGSRAQFPVDLQSAPRELLLRVPGLGVRSVQRLLATRRVRTLRLADLHTLRVPLAKVLPFVMLSDHHPGALLDAAHLEHHLLSAQVAGSRLMRKQSQWQQAAGRTGGPQTTVPSAPQLDLFDAPVWTGA